MSSKTSTPKFSAPRVIPATLAASKPSAARVVPASVPAAKSSASIAGQARIDVAKSKPPLMVPARVAAAKSKPSLMVPARVATSKSMASIAGPARIAASNSVRGGKAISKSTLAERKSNYVRRSDVKVHAPAKRGCKYKFYISPGYLLVACFNNFRNSSSLVTWFKIFKALWYEKFMVKGYFLL